ncbi:MAG: hypothetical protein J6N53_03110 [Lachnospiraceae bacterium]|nr:hypothetical protein [Lachnospiraceae bacterium]MBO6297812.1 hypothetical protein [Lachnospiraceae bacterium]MBP3296601.1 hypothetical protein [Lachnospiraceae bacterium]
MSKSSYRIPLYVATGLKALIMIITWGMLANQSGVYKLMGTNFHNSALRVSTPNGIYSILDLLIYGIFVGIVLKYEGEQRRLVSGIFIALSICMGLGSILVSRLWQSHIMRNNGQEYLAAFSILTSAISFSTSVPNAIAQALFYVSAGRYGMSYHLEEEEIPAPQYQNYQP